MKYQWIAVWSPLLLIMLIGCGQTKKIITKEEGASTTSALPEGMKLVWHDEFNGHELDTTKWFTQYYSQFDYISRTNWEDFQNNNLPEPAMKFTDSSIILYVDENTPERPYWKNGRRISSIQTYDWRTNKTKFDNRRGGYMEAKIRRNVKGNPTQVNGAFWLDSPGPDPRYFVEDGNEALGVKGIRPRGQVFEIDLCEYMTTEVVLHGNVSPEGRFERNIGHYIHKGDFLNKWVIHSMLWTPAGLKFFIDGREVREWWDPHDIKSPNHMMSIFLGAYGNEGEVSLECDYIRFYQWDTENDNEMPNSGFEYGAEMFPWEGEAKITTERKNTGNHSAVLNPGETLYQYVYVDPEEDYELDYFSSGKGSLEIRVDHIEAVSGAADNMVLENFDLQDSFRNHKVSFKTRPDYEDHVRTIRVTFANRGNASVYIDDITLQKSK